MRHLNELGYNQLHFRSIIDSDVYMFGLVYNTVIEGNNIDLARKEALMRELQNKISFFKRNDGHKASPSLLKYIACPCRTIYNYIQSLCHTSSPLTIYRLF